MELQRRMKIERKNKASTILKTQDRMRSLRENTERIFRPTSHSSERGGRL